MTVISRQNICQIDWCVCVMSLALYLTDSSSTTMMYRKDVINSSTSYSEHYFHWQRLAVSIVEVQKMTILKWKENFRLYRTLLRIHDFVLVLKNVLTQKLWIAVTIEQLNYKYRNLYITASISMRPVSIIRPCQHIRHTKSNYITYTIFLIQNLHKRIFSNLTWPVMASNWSNKHELT